MKIKIVTGCCLVSASLLSANAMALSLPGAKATADAPEWSYEQQSQPGGWGAIEGPSPVIPYKYPYAECANGQKQSPIDLAGSQLIRRINRPKLNWRPFAANFVNTGHDILVQPTHTEAATGSVNLGKDAFPLAQFHLHTPSEHTLNGQRFSAEMHFVHLRDDGRVAAVGFWVETGPFNPEFQKMLENTPNTPGVYSENPTQILMDPMSIIPERRGSFYNYGGSLTVPPCFEGVDWYFYDRPILVSAWQLTQLKGFYFGNNRDIQERNGRIPARGRR